MRIIEPSTSEELEKYYRLRYEILRKPWSQPESTTKDEQEDISIHVLMLDEKDEAIATGRLQLNSEEEGQIRSMAVREDMQGKGFGSAIMNYIELKAKEKKLKEIVLDAREEAVPFYLKHNYQIDGDSYVLFNVIRHFRMKKMIG